jgi:ubiquinone/menaquinone biosynthesis C-methylase UbiE
MAVEIEPDEARTRVHDMWARVADGWAADADFIDLRGAALTSRMLDGLAIGPGDRVLELACGPGGAGLAAARRVGDRGEVVVSDVVPAMVEIAAARAEAQGLGNVRARTLDLEAIDEPEGSFDAVLCREGLMFAVDPARALSEMRRVLRPGGRAAIAVWGPREQNPWLGLVFDAVAEVVGLTVPPPGMPGPFALSDAARLPGLLAGAGFDDVAICTASVPLTTPSFEAWWARTRTVAGPVAMLLAALDAAKTAEMERWLRAATDRYRTDAGLELPGVALLSSGRAAEGGY